jgi:RNA polymerase sigma factor (sigma-70 family)
MVSESEIIKGCVKGNRKYQEMLYKKYSSTMMGVCMRYFRKRDEAEDCLQEGFIKVFNSLDTYKGDGSFEGWIRKTMINTALNIYKTNLKYSNHTDIDDLKDVIADKNDNTDNISAQHLLKLIQDLPDGYRMVFNLYTIEGYSHKEISTMLNISEGTSKSQLSRARNMLQQNLSHINISSKSNTSNVPTIE